MCVKSVSFPKTGLIQDRYTKSENMPMNKGDLNISEQIRYRMDTWEIYKKSVVVGTRNGIQKYA